MRKITLSISILLCSLISQGQNNKVENYGNIGIGTTSPKAQLHINGDGRIRLSQTGSNVHWDINHAASAGFEIKNTTSGQTALRILNNGNIGIGENSPEGKLHVKSESPSVIIESIGQNLPFGKVYNSGLEFRAGHDLFRVGIRSAGALGQEFYLGDLNTQISIWNNTISLGYKAGTLTDKGQKVSLNTPWANKLAIGGKFANGYNLSVTGKSIFEQIEVQLQGDWPDYVFQKDYELMPLEDVENFIISNSHLPEVPSAAVIKKDGINIAEMNAVLLRKIEELTLYNIAMNKKILELESKIK